MRSFIKVSLVVAIIVLAIPLSIYLYITLSDFYYQHWGRWNEYENNVTKKYRSIIGGEPLVSYSYKIQTPKTDVHNYCYVAIFKLGDGVVDNIKNNADYLDVVTFEDVTDGEKFWDAKSALNNSRDVIKTKKNLLKERGPISWIKTPFPKSAFPEIGILDNEHGLRCFNYLDKIKDQEINFINGVDKKDLIKKSIDYGYNQEGYLQSYAVYGIARDSFWFPNEIYNGYTILIEPKLNLARVSYQDANEN